MEESLHVSANFTRNGIHDQIEFSFLIGQMNGAVFNYGLTNDGIRQFLDENLAKFIGNKLNIDSSCINVGEFTFWFDWVEQTV